MTRAWVGQGMTRREDAPLLRGAGRFVDDLGASAPLHVVFARGEAVGRLVAVETEAAQAMPGVAAVITGADLAGLGASAVNAVIPGMRTAPFEALARDRVSAVGQAVAAVAATSECAARDAAEAVAVEIVAGDPEPTAAEMAIEQAAGDVAGAFAGAAHVVEMRVARALVAPSALEPRAALVEIADGRVTAHLSTQTPFRARDDLARILGLAPESITVIAPDVGGAFGGKASIHPEEVVVAWAAVRLGRPVRWRATRSEEMLAATLGRGARLAGALALDANGGICGMTADLTFPLGSWTPYSAAIPLNNAARILPGPYRVPALRVSGRAASTPHAAVGIYRGAGRPEAAMVAEVLMDRAARASGMNALDLRRRNVLGPRDLPSVNAAGARIDSGDFPGLLDKVAGEHAELLAMRDARRRAGDLIGVGVGLYVEPCGQGWERASVRLGPDGRFVLATGTTAQGQGRETAAAQIAADALGVAPGRIDVAEGDTRGLADGIGALASRGTAIGGAAVVACCAEMQSDVARAAAGLLGCAPEVVVISEEGCAGGGASLGWERVAAAVGGGAREARWEVARETWSSGCCVACVSVDPDTGTPTVERLVWVDDAGRVINPVLAEGQLLGALAQGYGETFMERMVHDAGHQVLSGSLMDYALPRANDAPAVRLIRQETPASDNPLGAKGIGEAGCIGVPAALFNAVEDACAPLGVSFAETPLTAERIWRALRDAGYGEGR